MSHRVVAIRVDIKGDDMKITSLTQSPRGTRVMLDAVSFSGVKGDRAALRTKIAAAISELLPVPLPFPQ